MSFRKIISHCHMITHASDKSLTGHTARVQNILLSCDRYMLHEHVMVPWVNLNVHIFQRIHEIEIFAPRRTFKVSEPHCCPLCCNSCALSSASLLLCMRCVIGNALCHRFHHYCMLHHQHYWVVSPA